MRDPLTPFYQNPAAISREDVQAVFHRLRDLGDGRDRVGIDYNRLADWMSARGGYTVPRTVFQPTEYRTFHDWFLRKPTSETMRAARKMAQHGDLCSPAEGKIEYTGVVGDGLIELKQGKANVLEALRHIEPSVEKHKFIKMSLYLHDCHRVYAPVGGTVQGIYRFGSNADPFGRNNVTVIQIGTRFGRVFLCCIGELTIQDFQCDVAVGDTVRAVDEVGRFEWGSMILVVYPPDLEFVFDEDEHPAFIGDPIAVHPDTPGHGEFRYPSVQPEKLARSITADVPEKYKHIDFKPPQSVADTAEKGLEYRAKASPSNKGGLTPAEASKQGIGSGVQRAVNLKNRDNTSPEVVKQMAAFFARHEKNKGVSPEHKGEPWNDKGNVAWLIWGGDPGRAWAEKVKGQMEAADEKAKKKASMGTPSHRIAEESAPVEKALHPLAVIASEVESLESLWSDVQAILDTYAETVLMPVVGRIAAITLHSQRDCFTKCEHAMRHCERVQNMARTYLDENPGDETASAAMRDATMLYTRFAAGRAKSREMLSALSQKIMPKDLQRITAEAVETVRASLNYPNALSVTVHPYFAPCKVGDRTVDAMVFNVYLTAYPQPMGGAPDYQQFLLSQATLGDTSVYLTVIDRTNENATTQPVKVDAGAGKKILGYLKGWGNLSPAPTTKMAARPRKPLTREQVSAMGAAEINKWRDVLDKESSGITDELIAAGRGNERPTETVRMTDPLALRYIQNWKDTGLLRDEIARRYGPGAPTRLPRGFGPIKKFLA